MLFFLHMQENKLLKSLEKFGLPEKEAKVYLASLKLGPAPVQTIAKEAKVVRPTAYVMIESLQRRGLMGETKKGKRRLFIAGRPDHLRYLLGQQKASLAKKEEAAALAIKALTEAKGGEGEIEFELIDGPEGTRRLQQMAMETDNPIREAVNLEKVRKFIPPQFEGDVRKNINKKKVFAVAQESENYKSFGNRPVKIGRELDAGVYIVDDKVFFSVYGDEKKTLCVKNTSIAKSLSAMFDALYEESSLSPKERGYSRPS